MILDLSGFLAPRTLAGVLGPLLPVAAIECGSFSCSEVIAGGRNGSTPHSRASRRRPAEIASACNRMTLRASRF